MDLSQVFRGRRVLVTGHTGFKGSWLSIWLEQLGARVTGASLAPHTTPSLFELASLSSHVDSKICDLLDLAALRTIVAEARPEFVFHLAAQAIVRRSYASPVDTFATNVLGTVHVLEAVRQHAPEAAVVVVTSDKCYENHEWPWPYRESDPLGGHDPYSASKACAEIVARSWQRSFADASGGRIATARAGNVIGGGDWSEDRIVPDCVRALSAGEPIVVRNPHAIRPWQHVLEPLSGYLQLAARLRDSSQFADAWNFGPMGADSRTVRDLVQAFCERWGDGAGWRSADHANSVHEAGALTLTADKAMHILGWQPTWDFDAAVRETVDWYRAWKLGTRDPYEMCLGTIHRFVAPQSDQERPRASVGACR